MDEMGNKTDYEAMARRYRPANFSEVIGQEHIARTLQNAIAANRVAHAYLFSGAHGCGKTTMARIFASALVCETGITTTPCGKCELCKNILRGGDVDVIEIDGASNNGVEQVRELREQAVYAPTRARFKIYIIDEAHMLTVSAFNALLKTLEEPPAQVKFILATTDPHLLPPTILSRCQRFDFRLVPAARLSEFFHKLVAQENAEITADALAAIAAFSGGSVRDGLVLLDQLLSFSSGKVTRADVEQLRGMAGAEMVAGLYAAICEKNLVEALRLLDEIAQRGVNVGDFLDQLIDFGRDLLQVVATKKYDQVVAYGPARETIEKLSQILSLEQILLILDIFSEARTRVRQRALSNPQVPLEMAVARLAGVDNLIPLQELLDQISPFASGANSGVVVGDTTTAYRAVPANAADPVSKEQDANPSAISAAGISKSKIAAAGIDVSPKISSAPAVVDKNGGKKNAAQQTIRTAGADDPTELWEKIKQRLIEQQPADVVYLADLTVNKIENGSFYFECGALVKEQWEEAARRRRLMTIAQELTGRECRFIFSLRSPAKRKTARFAEIAEQPEIAWVLTELKGTICDIT